MKRTRPAILAVAGLLWAFSALAEQHGTQGPTPSYKPSQNTAEAATEGSPSTETLPAWIVTPQMSILSPMTFQLKTGKYTFPYADNFAGLPILSIGAARQVFEVSNVRVYAEGRAGYGFKSGRFGFHDDRGAQLNEQLSLSWIPLSGALRGVYHIPTVTFIKPCLSVGGGVQWLYQNGPTSALTDSHWFPFFLISPGLVFLESTSPKDWFGGFNFSTTLLSSFASNQTLRGLSFDLSLNILL